MRFAPEYVQHVLNENFEDAKALFLSSLLSIHDAHVVREHGVSFRTAHAITARVLNVRAQHPEARPAETLAAVAFELPGRPSVNPEERLAELLSPRCSVSVRRTPGGPAPEETARAVVEAETILSADPAWLLRERAAAL